MVGDHEVLEPDELRGARHRGDRGRAVRPLGVAVQVALQLRPEAEPGLRDRRAALLAEVGEVRRHRAADRLGDDGVGRVADALRALQPTVAHPGGEVVGGVRADDVGRPPERLGLERRGAVALQQEGDLLECGDGVHPPILARGRESRPASAGATRVRRALRHS